METVELLKDVLPPEKLSKWQERIDSGVKSLSGIIRKTSGSKEHIELLKNGSVRNHFVWEVLCCYRYGMLKSDQNLMDFCTSIMEDIFEHQNTLGSWLEYGTPVVSYAYVTFEAISLYEHYSGNKKATEAIRKSLDYAFSTMYPDMTRIGCLDGRNRYSASPVSHIVPTYYKYESGLAYLCKWITNTRNVENLFATSIHALSVISNMMNIIPDDIPFIEPDIKKYMPESIHNPELKYNLIRKGPWVVSFCSLEQKIFNSRWILYRQNLYSIYHEDAGEIVGGGHSIAQPQFSCFNVISGPCVYYMHNDSKILENPYGMELIYGGKKCSITFEEINEGGVTIRYKVQDLSEVDRVYVNIPLYGLKGSALSAGEEKVYCGENILALKLPSGKPLVLPSVKIEVSEDAVFNYPIYPFNSYIQDQKGASDDASGIITVELDYKRPECILKLRI